MALWEFAPCSRARARRTKPVSEWLDLANPILSLVLLSIGLICLLTRKRIIKQVIGLSIMLQGALLTIVEAGRVNGDLQVAQSMVVSALVVETIILAIVLVLIVNVFRYHPRGRVDDLDTLRG
ncbi:MAG: NADH-quinone oxidoreductase subunit K [Anaerolineales bacterium]|nr:MAG: NADH-quinone oxidoreductase subunit K [Anaerolineales bacterium]